jgi:hypothetical protein
LLAGPVDAREEAKKEELEILDHLQNNVIPLQSVGERAKGL